MNTFPLRAENIHTKNQRVDCFSFYSYVTFLSLHIYICIYVYCRFEIHILVLDKQLKLSRFLWKSSTFLPVSWEWARSGGQSLAWKKIILRRNEQGRRQLCPSALWADEHCDMAGLPPLKLGQCWCPLVGYSPSKTNGSHLPSPLGLLFSPSCTPNTMSKYVKPWAFPAALAIVFLTRTGPSLQCHWEGDSP